MPLDTPRADDVGTVQTESPPAVFGPEIVFVYQTSYSSAPFLEGVSLHSVTPEDQSGNTANYTSSDSRISTSPWQLIPDRISRVAYLLVSNDSVVDTINSPILEYNLATNVLSVESNQLGTNFPGALDNNPVLVNNKEYAYKIINIRGGTPTSWRINPSAFWGNPEPINYTHYFGRHAIDDADGRIYTIESGLLISNQLPRKVIDTGLTDADGSNTDIVFQGNHIILSQAKTMYVLWT